jgi:hypothetical protein
MTWRGESSCPHRDTNSDPSVVQPVASRYTDWAIPALLVHGRDTEELSNTVFFTTSASVKTHLQVLCLLALDDIGPRHITHCALYFSSTATDSMLSNGKKMPKNNSEEKLNCSIILCVSEISLLYSVSTTGSRGTPYICLAYNMFRLIKTSSGI